VSAPGLRLAEGVKWFRLELPSDPSSTRLVSHGLRCFLRACGWERREAFRIDLAVNEALDNAITHGNLHRWERQVCLTVADDGEALVVEVQDEGLGAPFDPDSLQSLRTRNEALAERGRGVALMKKLMDEVTFVRDPDGHRVRMLKRRPDAGQKRRAG
jgi:serine/threonine-protein kinase RsbW